MDLELLVTAVGLALIIEGVPYFLFPGGVKSMASQMLRMSPRTLRIIGLVNMLIGLVIIYLGRSI